VRRQIRFLENPGYGYAVGRVRALELKLLDRQRYDRLVRAGSLEEFAQILGDTAYAESVTAGSATGLARAQAENRDFLARYALDPWLTGLYQVRADFHNLRLMTRSRVTGAGFPGMNLDFGARAEPELARLLAPAGSKTRPDRLGDQLSVLLACEPGPVEIDVTLDRMEQEELLDRLGPSDYLTGYLRLRADIKNLFAGLRLRGASAAELEAALLPGGTVPARSWRALHRAEPAAYQRRFRYTEIAPLCDSSIDEFPSGRSADRLERSGREIALAYLLRARYAVVGHEPLACFYLFRENEIANLRRLHAAKAAGRPPEECADLVACAA
jgi:V/A-type H+/Na+-transporting ATPase subunit C